MQSHTTSSMEQPPNLVFHYIIQLKHWASTNTSLVPPRPKHFSLKWMRWEPINQLATSFRQDHHSNSRNNSVLLNLRLVPRAFTMVIPQLELKWSTFLGIISYIWTPKIRARLDNSNCLIAHAMANNINVHNIKNYLEVQTPFAIPTMVTLEPDPMHGPRDIGHAYLSMNQCHGPWCNPALKNHSYTSHHTPYAYTISWLSVHPHWHMPICHTPFTHATQMV